METQPILNNENGREFEAYYPAWVVIVMLLFLVFLLATLLPHKPPFPLFLWVLLVFTFVIFTISRYAFFIPHFAFNEKEIRVNAPFSFKSGTKSIKWDDVQSVRRNGSFTYRIYSRSFSALTSFHEIGPLNTSNDREFIMYFIYCLHRKNPGAYVDPGLYDEAYYYVKSSGNR